MRRDPAGKPKAWTEPEVELERGRSSPCRARGRAARQFLFALRRPTGFERRRPPHAGGRRDRKQRHPFAPTRFLVGGLAERAGAAMASSGIGMNAGGSSNEAPEIPDNVGDWLRGVYRFATDRNDFRRNLILNLGLFAAGVWLARNLSDIDLMAPQPGV